MNPTDIGVTPVPAAEARKFPTLRGKEEDAERLMEWLEAARFYKERYPNETTDVEAMFTKANEVLSKPEVANPVYGLSVPEGNYADIERRLRSKREVKVKFDFDSYHTRFRKVGDDIWAYDPDHPEGRKLIRWVSGDPKSVPTSQRMILSLCVDPTSTSYGGIVARLVLAAIETAGKDLPFGMTLVMLSNACLAAKIAHAHGLRILCSGGRFDVCGPASSREDIQRLVVPMTHVSALMNSML